MTVGKRGERESAETRKWVEKPAELADKPVCPCPECKEDRCGDCDEWGCDYCLERRLARAEKAEATVRGLEQILVQRNAEVERLKSTHDDWCEYRKRLELSFALGKLSGAIEGADR